MFTDFTVSGASLQLLKVGERGIIARIRDTNPRVVEELRRLGLSPGTSIILEQRFPRFIVRTHKGPLALTQAMIQAVYVRLRAS